MATLNYGEENPPNNSPDQWLNTRLSITVNGTSSEFWDFYFLTNDTIDGSWVVINKYPNILVFDTTQQISTYFSGLDWNKTYWWRVSAYNPKLKIYANSSVFSFRTKLTDPEPNVTYYSMGAQIRITSPNPDIERPHPQLHLLLAIVPVLLSLYLILIYRKKSPNLKIHLFHPKKL